MHPKLRLLGSSVLLVAAVLFSFDSLQSAHAGPEGPVVTGGSHPWLSFAGEVPDHTTETVYTVPADRVFVLTGYCAATASNGAFANNMTVLQDAVVKVPLALSAGKCNSGNFRPERNPLTLGTARLTFDPGSTVVLDHDSSGNLAPAKYWIQGYLAAP